MKSSHIKVGKLTFNSVDEDLGLVAEPVRQYLGQHGSAGVLVGKIDSDLADTAAFCEHYQIGLDVSANCVIVAGQRAGNTQYAACLVLATDRADVNGAIRRQLDARKASFAPMDTATSLTRMEYGGITPIGLPAEWPIFIDSRVCEHDHVIIGSGIRGSKLYVATAVLAGLPNAQVIGIVKGA